MHTRILILILLIAGYVHAASPDENAQVKRGKYLTVIGACNDCHTPKIFSEKGMDVDWSKELSGYQAGTTLPEYPKDLIGPGKWTALTADLTAWFGPWGISFARNLTPDVETGLGSWTEDMFMKAIRTGKHMGAPAGRDILPPMPWQMYAHMTDEDLKAVWAYLRTLKPVKNPTPEPVPPSK